MKKNIVILICIHTLLWSSCTDYLDKQPLDQISSATFWKTKDDLNMALTAIYGQNANIDFWSYLLPNWDNLTDNSYGQHSYNNTKDIVVGDITSNTGGFISDVYSNAYRGIARVNLFIDQLTKYQNNDVTTKDKTSFEAEARFFRAFYYFQLYCIYGDVPLVTEPLKLENEKQPKVTSDKIYNQVLTDIDYAITNLNDVPYYQNSGHLVKTSAQALKARILIYHAYGNNGIPDNAILKNVVDLCNEIIPKYQLSPKFEDIFQDKGQPGNKEIIFSLNFLAPNNVPGYGADLLFGDWIVVSPLQNFVDAFECTDGLPWGISPLTDKNKPFNNRDPRLRKTVFVDHPDWGNGAIHNPTNGRPTGYGLNKFLCPENIPYTYATLSEQDAVVLRLGEVLLMYAEAENEIDGPTASVYNAMTSLRGRVSMPPYPKGLTKDQMRERIRHERRIELAFEGLRYFDLKRWHIAATVLPYVKDGLLTYKWEDRFYHWPLPQAEIDKNDGVLVQNPDYK